MESVATTKPISTSRARTFLGSLLLTIQTWATQYCLSIGIFTILAGINGYYSDMVNINLSSIIPFASETAVILGGILSIMGIIGKGFEFSKNFKKWRKKLKHK